MTTKKLIALLIAVFMLIALFSACGPTETPEDTGNTGDTGTKEDDKKEDDKKEEEPPVEDPLTLTWVGQESHNWKYTLADGIAKGFESWKNYNEQMLAQHNLICEASTIDNESYKTTITSYLAANQLPDSFLCEGFMDTDVLVGAINNGKFANFNDILEYSDGTFADLVADGGAMQYIKAWSSAPDGEWYMMKCADGNGTSFNFDHGDVDYINNWPLHTWYNANIRVDWLNKCGLSMPTTTAEVLEALVQFQEQDVNGTGTKDERAFFGLGMATEQCFSNGLGNWFGLPRANFAMSPITGALENAIEGEGYLPFVDYAGQLYAAGVVLLNEGGSWSYGANVAGNYCAIQCMYPDNLITAQTGDADCQYEPMPIIQAVSTIKPRMLGQSVTTANNAMAFRADCDYDAAARYLDWLNGETFYILLGYGIEGKAWEYNTDGSVKIYKVGQEGYTQEMAEDVGPMWHYAPWAGFPQIQAGFAWDFIRAEYTTVQSALDAGEPYTWKMMTLDAWKTQFEAYNWTEMSNLNRFFLYMNDFGTDNIVFNLNVNFTTLASTDEASVIGMYGTDLTTYLAETTTNYIVKNASTDTYEADVQYAYDNLHMQEYMNAMQARINRYLTAMGRDAVAIAE